MTTTAPAIEIENLSYYYKSQWSWRKFCGLKNLSLTVHAGESFGFLGPNGAGKTTTIKCLLGLIRPSTGCARLFGKDCASLESRMTVGYLPEQPYFYDHLTVRETLSLYAALARVERCRIKEAVQEAVDMVKLEDKTASRTRALSKGLMQRVAMAQAVIAKPRLLILDEPLSGLDPIGRKEFADILCEQKKRGVTIFMSSHILSDVEFLCRRVSILSHGELKGVFDLDDVPAMINGRYELVVRNLPGLKAELSPFSDDTVIQDVFLRLYFSDKANAEAALACAIHSGAGVESFQFLHGGLEELFVKLVKFEEGPASSKPLEP